MVAALVMFICQVAVQAQVTTGSLAGVVTDQNGAIVSGATITIKNNGTGEERKATSNENGAYSISQLTPGIYSITVETKGFKKAVNSEIKISVSTETKLDVGLQIGLETETVTVTTGQEVINTSSPTITNVINTRQVVDLPLGDRNPVALAGLQAGIAVVGTDVRGSSVSGLRQTAVNLTQDGINAMDNFVKTSSFFAITTPSLNSTEEFSVTTGTVGSDQGRGAAQVNIVTKGGTNEYHGGGFYQRIHESLNANTFFNNFNGLPIPKLRQRFWGFDFGGPVKFPAFGEGGPKIWDGKDTAFFFFSYERFEDAQGRANNRTVLSQDARNGTFKYNVGGVTQTLNLLSLSSRGFGLNSIIANHLALIPLPNNSNCANSDGFNILCYTFNVTQDTTNDKYVFRYDHQLVKDTSLGSHKLEFVYSRVKTRTFPDVTTNGIDAPFPGGVHGFQASSRNLITPALVSTFGSNVTNTVRYGRQWAPVDFNRDSMPTAPFFALSGVLTNYDNTFMPQPRNTTVNQITDNLSWVKGNHLWKFGADWQSVEGFSLNDAGINEQINFGTNAANPVGFTLSQFPGLTNNTAGNNVVTAATTVYTQITGMLASATQTLNVSSPTSGFIPGFTRERAVLGKDLSLFAQDQWRMRSNFTLNYGVRWEFIGVPTVPNGLAIQPGFEDMYGVSGFGNLFTPTAPPGSQVNPVATLDFVSGDTGIPLYNNDWNNFAPFVGFAWSPDFKSGIGKFFFGESGQSSIRGGYSQSYLHDGVTTFTNLLGTGTTNPGLIQTANRSTLGTGGNSANLLGVIGPGGVPLIFDPFIMPVTDRQNFLSNFANGLWTADPNLRAAYVHQYSFGYEREIFKDMALEIRYVGNKVPNNWRAFDINEVNIFENHFLQEFNNAKINLAANGGTTFAPGCATCVATPLLDKLFAGLSSNSGYTSSGFISNLNNNNVGTMASTLAFNSNYRANRENPANGIAANFFVANPNATFSRILTNDAISNYNALEIELRKRFSAGLQFQFDYTWSKAMGDAVDAQGNNQSDLVNRLTLRHPELDYRRSGQDQTQRIAANGIYELPFGPGKPFLSDTNGFVSRLVGGWTIGAIYVWSTGVPFFIQSGRATFNSATANNGAQLVGISFEDFKKNVGLFKTPGGILFINPDILDLTFNSAGKIATSRLKSGLMSSPAPGTFGNFPVNSLDGPQYWNFDFSLIKRIPITEKVRLEFKVTAINILNHANFIYGTTSFDSSTFGLITTQRGGSRSLNWIGQLRF